MIQSWAWEFVDGGIVAIHSMDVNDRVPYDALMLLGSSIDSLVLY